MENNEKKTRILFIENMKNNQFFQNVYWLFVIPSKKKRTQDKTSNVFHFRHDNHQSLDYLEQL